MNQKAIADEEILNKCAERAQKEIKHYTGKDVDLPLIKKALPLFEPLLQRLSSPPIPMVGGLIQYAEKDLESAELLFEKRLYPPSIFHLQQAIEKLAKAFALSLGLVEEKELYGKGGIGHISPRSFILILREKGAMDLVYLVYQVWGKGKRYEEMRKSVEDFEKLLQKKKELARLSKEGILHLIKKKDGIIDVLSKIDVREFRSRIEKIRIGIKARDRYEGPPLGEGILWHELGKKETIEEILRKLMTFVDLYILTIITFPHSSFSRYPLKGGEVIRYEEGLGIVDCAETLLSITKKTLEEVKVQLVM